MKASAWTAEERVEMAAQRERDNAPGIEGRWTSLTTDSCLCSWCVEARLREAHRARAERLAMRMREARERAGASCP